MEQLSAKRRFSSREGSVQPQYHHHNENKLYEYVDIGTNTECQKPMLLNAWTQTEPDISKIRRDQIVMEETQDRIRKLEELSNELKEHIMAFNEIRTNQSQNLPINCINGKTIQNLQLHKKSPTKSRQHEKTTYKIIAGPSGMEIVEPIEVEYAEEDGTYLDHDLNVSNDSNRLEICIPKEEYSTHNEHHQQPQQQQQPNIEQTSQQHQQNSETYSIPEYVPVQTQSMQQEHHQTIHLQSGSSSQNSCQTINSSHIAPHSSSSQLYQQLNGNYHHHTVTHSQPPQQHQDNNITRNIQYISVVHPNIIGNSNEDVQQQQNVSITSQYHQSPHQRSTTNSPVASTSSMKPIQRNYVSQENLLNNTTSAPEMSNEVTVPTISSSHNDSNHHHNHHHHIHLESDEGNSSSTHEKLISLGPNNTSISSIIYDTIDWTSVTAATRKLLITLFDRKTLSTHTMTGKPSPVFKGRNIPIKHKLNPEAVQDIIYVVCRNCNVPPKEVRSAITTKCADENKMWKLRERKLKGLQESNKENITNNEPADA